MGYRNYIGKVPKTFVEKVKNLTSKEVCEQFDNAYKPTGYTEFIQVYGLGNIRSNLTDVYSFNVYEEEECEFGILSKQGLAELISEYSKLIKLGKHQQIYKVINACRDMLEPVDVGALLNRLVIEDHDCAVDLEYDTPEGKQGIIYAHASQLRHEAEGLAPNLDSDTPIVMNGYSNLDDYINLINIYKTFDWENDYLIFNGH